MNSLIMDTNLSRHLASNATSIPIHSSSQVNSESPGMSTPECVGFICAIVTAVLYSCACVPVKKYKTGDGMFFQWIFCNGVFFSGLGVQMIRNCELYILPMLGGVIWTIGNLCVVPIIAMIGIGMNFGLAAPTTLCMGWAIGRFGLFGTQEATIKDVQMNNSSVVLALISVAILLLVKNEVSSSNMDIPPKDDSPLFRKDRGNTSMGNGYLDHGEEEKEFLFLENLSTNKKRIIGSSLSIFSGVMYAGTFTPSQYVQKNYPGASQNGLDYIFGQFCGIYLASTAFFIVYCICMKNKPRVYPKVIIPGLISGVLWAIGTGCWNIANSILSQAISYPIVASGPCGISALFFGVLIFKEIRGRKNIAIVIVGFSINLFGSLLAGLSK